MKNPVVRKKKNNLLRQVSSYIHLWLGLVSGLIVFVIAITGCVFVFQDELKDIFYDWRHVTPQEQPFAAPSLLLKNVKKAYPASTASMVVYQTGDRPAAIGVEIDHIPHEVYLNPYNGKIIHVQNMNTEFFMVVEHLHRFLLLPEDVGKQITGVATLIFVLMLLTGLVLWWPKKRKNTVQHLKIKWNAKWRRKNYDWHRATGFYLIIPALIIAITGLSFTYEWLHDQLYTVGNIAQEAQEEPLPTFLPSDQPTSMEAMDLAMTTTRTLLPHSGMYFVWDQGEGLPIVTGAYPQSLAFDHQSNFYFDAGTGSLLHSQFYKAKPPGLKLQEMIYGLHTGQYLRLPGKILAFIASALIAALPITGFYVWYGRRKKAKK